MPLRRLMDEKSGEGEGESGEEWSHRGWNSYVEQWRVVT